MLDQELAAAGEQVGQRLLAGGTVEHVALVDPDPGQLAALGGERVAGAQKFLLLGEQRLAGGGPFLAGNDLVGVHGLLLRQLRLG